ncbi:undecaprenyl-phosphate glucose phosphotransferase [Bremerella cremea]|uniref:Undecaprenyl-phosphate glucose phosphotransferase n=1 Tax=Bremerella cremea TaxID=1031537 RepID=A0A368KL24_9BACT|nr:undecaprenyl-phosphate glucose phosphotransferase [Bremerella cremea]RCS41468.1 undecaprenyl-phosphate glucose phosphotransferase [Bremerella cremea]
MTDRLRNIQYKSTILDGLYRVIDAVAIILGMVLAVLGAGEQPESDHRLAVAAVLAIYYVVAEFTGVYRNWRGVSTQREIACGVLTWTISLGILFLCATLFHFDHSFNRYALVSWYLTTPLLMTTARMILRTIIRWMLASGVNQLGVAIVGVNELGIQLAKNIRDTPDLGMKVYGFYDDRPSSRLPAIPDHLGACVGNLHELVEAARRGEIHRIYITFPMRAETRIRNVLNHLGDTTASVYIVPDFFVFDLLHSRWSDIRGLPVVSVYENPLLGVDGILKRVSDIILASLALLILAVPMLLVALAVKLTSKGPIFFKQRRYGLDGQEILVWKFRSMTVCEDGATVTQATKNDSRLTPIGGFLRKTSIDELPQLFNVLFGSMSLVGPRPHASAHNEQYRKLIQHYMLRHKVKPGITGLAQVSGWRGETDTMEKMERRVQCDHEYIRNWSLWLDLRILFKTVFVLFGDKNAY